MNLITSLTCIVHSGADSDLDSMSNFLLTPAQYLGRGKTLTVLGQDKYWVAPIFDGQGNKSWITTAAMIGLLVPSVIMGGLCKIVAVCLWHNREADTLYQKYFDLTGRDSDPIFTSSMEMLASSRDSFLFGSWQSGGNLEEAKRRIRKCFLEQSPVLDLRGLGLTTLPESIGQLTHLKGLACSGNRLTTLPDSVGDLVQLEELTLACNGLNTLPDNLRSLTRLKIVNCEYNNLSNPQPILSLPCGAHVDVSQNPLSDEFTTQFLHATLSRTCNRPRRIEISLRDGAINDIVHEHTLEEMLERFISWVAPSDYSIENISQLWAGPRRQIRGDLETWLNKLFKYAPEISDAGLKVVLARRVLEVFHFASRNPFYRDGIFSFYIASSLENCIDRTAYYLSQLEASMQLSLVDRDPRKLLSIFKQAWALELLSDIAEKNEELNPSETIEIHLAYMAKLRKRWFPDLISPFEMRFAGISGVTEREMAEADSDLSRTVNNPNPEAFSAFLIEYHPWKIRLDQAFPNERVRLLEPFAQLLADLPTEHEGTYRAQVARILALRNQAEKEWKSRKTRELLGV